MREASRNVSLSRTTRAFGKKPSNLFQRQMAQASINWIWFLTRTTSAWSRFTCAPQKSEMPRQLPCCKCHPALYLSLIFSNFDLLSQLLHGLAKKRSSECFQVQLRTEAEIPKRSLPSRPQSIPSQRLDSLQRRLLPDRYRHRINFPWKLQGPGKEIDSVFAGSILLGKR